MSDVLYTFRESKTLFQVTGIFTVYDTYFDKDYNYKGEVHNFWELVYVQEGDIGITAHNKIYEMQAGQVVLHKPGEFHSIWSTKGSTPKVFIISFNLDKLVPELERSLYSVTREGKFLLEQLIIHCKSLTTVYNPGSNSNHLQCNNRVILGMDHLIKNYLELFLIDTIHQKSETIQETQVMRLKIASYDKVMSYIQHHLEEPITIATICEHCNMSSSTLKSIFKKYVGVGAMEYVNKMKIYKAMELLGQGYSSQEVSDQLAFSSPYYFSSVFKRITGMTPTEYKKQ